MLSKLSRIKKEKDFEEIFRDSKSVKTALFIFRLRKNSMGFNRFAFVVSKKVSTKAVVRNKVRRRLSEAIKAKLSQLKTGNDLVVVALPGIEKKEFLDIKEAVNKALDKSGLLNLATDNKNV